MLSDNMQTKDWPVVKEAKKMAEHQLEFYDEMMERKVIVTKPEQNPIRMLSDQTDGLYPRYFKFYLR